MENQDFSNINGGEAPVTDSNEKDLPLMQPDPFLDTAWRKQVSAPVGTLMYIDYDDSGSKVDEEGRLRLKTYQKFFEVRTSLNT